MSPSQQIESRTRMFARVIGPYLLIVTVTAILRASDMRTLLSEFGANSVWPFVTGAFVLPSGLVVVALHQSWRGAAAILVSLLGWLTTLKGFFLLAIPQTYISWADTALDEMAWWRVAFVVLALAGLYLTYAGWAPTRSRPTTQAAPSTPDLKRAA
jgi:hypothetical protein